MSSSDCAICLEIIEEGKNCVTTECGHMFHTSCLMRNVHTNGFACPYCRTAMYKNPHEINWNVVDEGQTINIIPEGDEYSISSHDQLTNVEEYDTHDDIDINVFQTYTQTIAEDSRNNNYIMRGFRLFWNNAYEYGQDIDDVIDEDVNFNNEDESDTETLPPFVTVRRNYNNYERPTSRRIYPSVNSVAESLFDRGVFYEDLVKVLLLQHEEYADDRSARYLADDVSLKIKLIIRDNMTPVW
jgi:hypothetical protein